MPTIISENGFRLYFYANEGKEPAHIHVQYQSSVAKFWIEPVTLAKNLGMNAAELGKAAKIVKKHEQLVRGKWHEFNKRKN